MENETTDFSQKKIKPRKVFFAFLFSLFFPGLGQIYNGQLLKGILFFCIPVINLFIIGHFRLFVSLNGFFACILFQLFFILYILIDAIKNAKRQKEYEIKKINKWYVYLLYCILFIGLLNGVNFSTIIGARTFSVPTSSNIPTLLLGDYFISDTKIYKNDPVKNEDMVVFHYPEGDTVIEEFQSNRNYYDVVRELGRKEVWNKYTIVSRSTDQEEYFIKRCVGIPNDKIEIVDQQIYVNGTKIQDDDHTQYYYTVKTNGGQLNKKIFEKYDITEGYKYTDENGILLNADSYNFAFNYLDSSYVLILTKNVAEELKKIHCIVSVTKMLHKRGTFDIRLFPFDTTNYKWNVDNYGPVTIPAAGQTIELNSKNLNIYRRIIDIYEGNDLLEKDGKIFINGKETTAYTFKMNYYWMMGDSRHNSADSRFWGFVPEDHIAGKAIFVWLSLDPDKGWFNGKIRWDKMFRIIN